VAQHPFQRAAIFLHGAVDRAVEQPGQEVAFAGVLRAQQAAAHHRRERQRDDGGYHHRDRQGQRELAEHAADQAGHEQQRDEYRDQRHRQRDHRKADLTRPAQRGVEGILPLLDVADDVLDHHDGIVDYETGADGQRH
jgi:hypothetical protein